MLAPFALTVIVGAAVAQPAPENYCPTLREAGSVLRNVFNGLGMPNLHRRTALPKGGEMLEIALPMESRVVVLVFERQCLVGGRVLPLGLPDGPLPSPENPYPATKGK